MKRIWRNPVGNWLRSVRYHSARRESTRWTHAMDTALFAAPVLGVVLALVLHFTAIGSERHDLAFGGLERDTGGGVVHAVLATPAQRPGSRATPIGSFWISRTEEYRGWPMPTVLHRRPPQIHLDLFAEATVGRRAAGDADTALVDAVELAIARGGEATSDLRNDLALPAHVTNWWALLANGALCWIGVYLALAVSIQCVRFVAWRVEVRRQRRRRKAARQGICLKCGYDLRANLWSERCPECGALLE